MRNHTVEIGDRNGKSFKIYISTPAFWDNYKGRVGSEKRWETLQITGSNIQTQRVNQDAVGSWRTIDKGFIR